MGGFLDTTAMVDLLFKGKSVADRVRKQLAALGPKYTSQYVRMEIKRGGSDISCVYTISLWTARRSRKFLLTSKG